MLTPRRALTRSIDAGRELPRVPAFGALYDLGIKPRHGQTVMIAGRSGTQKTGFALYWTVTMGLPTLYFSADSGAFTASTRVASIITGHTTEEIESAFAHGEGEQYSKALADSKMTFSFDSPITWRAVDEELESYVELWDQYPAVVVLDNLMDFDGAESDYTEQMAVMSGVRELSSATGSTVIILHHATDKGWAATTDPWAPPSRDQIKGGLSEKPELSLSVALDPSTLDYRVACIKQRIGPSDPSARRYATLRAEPERTRFSAHPGYGALKH